MGDPVLRVVSYQDPPLARTPEGFEPNLVLRADSSLVLK
jgi:hypothetical protein